MKKLLCILLALTLCPLYALAADSAKYTATSKISGPIYAEMDTESKTVGRVNPNASVSVYALYPDWALVGAGGKTGYVPRRYLNAGKAIDAAATPPWGVEFYHYVGVVGANGVTIHTAPAADSEALIVLGEGARITLIDLADGWGRLSYYRQYGYVNTNELKELLPVCTDAASGTGLAPIAAFTSYYVVGSDDEVVRGKEINIGINCFFMNGDVLEAGETLDYDNYFGPYSRSKGYVNGPVLLDNGWGKGPGGGVCQVSSTLYNVLLQLPGISILQRSSHGPSGISYLPLDMDAAVGNQDKGINMVVRNDYDFDLRFEAQAQDGALYIAIYKVME